MAFLIKTQVLKFTSSGTCVLLSYGSGMLFITVDLNVAYDSIAKKEKDYITNMYNNLNVGGKSLNTFALILSIFTVLLIF